MNVKNSPKRNFAKISLLGYAVFTCCLVFSVLGFPQTAFAMYDYASDPNCVALYDFESGAITADSKNSNTLTSNGSPTTNLLDYRQGLGSADLSRTTSDWFSVAEASLQADFPGKAASDMSSCFWVRPHEASPSGNRYIMSKFASSPSPFIVQYTTEQKIKVYIGAATSTLQHSSALTINQWYHVCFSYNHGDQSGRIHIYDDTAGATLGADATGTFSSAMTLDATDKFAIGSNSAGAVNNLFDGNIDELAIFKDVLSTGEMDTIRAGAVISPDYLNISTPVQYQTYQRTTSTTGPISVDGVYSGSPTAVECSFNGGGYSTIDAAPSLGTWSGALASSLVGDATLSCRFTNDTNLNDSVSNVRVGDVFMVMGQSNAAGRGDNDQTYSGSNHGASQFDVSGNWEPLSDANGFLQTSYGSVWPLLGTLINNNENVPVAFIGYAEGATGFLGNDWNEGDAMYTNAVDQFNNSGVNDIKAFLWYQGENDVVLGNSAGAYETALSNMLNAIQTDLTVTAPLVAALIGEYDANPDANINAIRTGLINAWTNDADIYAGPTAHDQNFVDGLHWTTNSELQELANRWYRTLSSYFYEGSESARGPQFSSAQRTGAQLINVVFTGGEGNLNDETDTEGWVVSNDGVPIGIDGVSQVSTNTVQIDTSSDLAGVVTIDYLTGSRSSDAAWRDSGTYPLPPEPLASQTVSTPPLVSTLSPADNATGVYIDASLTITFDDSVDAETGNIELYTADNVLVEQFDVTSDISGTGTTTITINPSVNLRGSTAYYVQIDATAFDDVESYSYAGISDTTTWSFTTIPTSGTSGSSPVVHSFSPADNSEGTQPDTSLSIFFNQQVYAGTGVISVKKTADNSLAQEVDILDSGITGWGSTYLTIPLPEPLEYDTEYYVNVENTAVLSPDGQTYNGVSDTTTWSFTTVKLAPSAGSSITSSGDSSGDSSVEESNETTNADASDENSTTSVFPDVSSSHQNSDAIESLYSSGIINGYPDGEFKPEVEMNRAELLKVTVLMSGVTPSPEIYKDCFYDVSDEWFAPYVCYAKEKGWVNGYDDGFFRPELTVNKAEFFKILLNVMEFEITEVSEGLFTDVPQNIWYEDFAFKAKELGLLDGESELFDPEVLIERGPACEYIFRLKLLN